MIERIEVLTDGASSVYGSDAVAGVVNFILRSDYQGAEFSTNYGISDKDDGENKGYQFTFGQSSDKGSIMAGISYNKTEQVLAGSPRFLEELGVAVRHQRSGSVGRHSDRRPCRRFDVLAVWTRADSRSVRRSCSPIATRAFSRASPARAARTSRPTTTATSTTARATAPSDKYNFATVNLIMTPQERTGLFLNGNYKLTDNIEVYAAVMHNKTSSAFQLAPAVYGSPFGGIISADSYYNPFGVEFSRTQFDYRSRFAALGNRRVSFGTNTDQVQTGFKGTFSVWNDQQWNWEVGMDYGHISLSTTTYGLPNLNIINQATGPSFLGDDGVVHCGTPGAIINGCTPINIFNLEDPNTLAVLRTASSPASSAGFTQEKVWRGDMNGGLFELPAGTMQLAIGASYRKEYTHANTDTSLLINPATGNCVLGSQCASPLQGGYNVKEVYAELFVPILKDIPFVHALNLTIGDRYSKYNNFGSTNNTKVALEWRPIEDLLLRGTVSQVFRAPTVLNLFGAAANDAPQAFARSLRRLHRQSGQSGLRRTCRPTARSTTSPSRSSCRSTRSPRVRSSRVSRSARSSASRSTGASCTTRISSRAFRSAPTTGVSISTTSSPTSARRACSIFALRASLPIARCSRATRPGRTRARS